MSKKVNESIPTQLDMEVFFFCRNPAFSYISTKTRIKTFKKGKINQLSFHKAGLPQEALRTEIELFAKRVSDYLVVLGYDKSDPARKHIRDTLKNPEDPMQNLLTVLAKNFHRITKEGTG